MVVRGKDQSGVLVTDFLIDNGFLQSDLSRSALCKRVNPCYWLYKYLLETLYEIFSLIGSLPEDKASGMRFLSLHEYLRQSHNQRPA